MADEGAEVENENLVPSSDLSSPTCPPHTLVQEEYTRQTIYQQVKSRVGWLALFLVGLWSAAFGSYPLIDLRTLALPLPLLTCCCHHCCC